MWCLVVGCWLVGWLGVVVANRLQRNRLRCCCVVFSSMGLVLARGGHGVHVVEVEAVAQVLLAVAVVVLAVPEIRLSKGGRQGGGGYYYRIG